MATALFLNPQDLLDIGDNQFIEPDDGEESTAEYAESVLSDFSDTTSLSSSVYHYDEENGRRYHSFERGKYVLPNDETEQGRLELAHTYWITLLRGYLLRAPVSKEEPIRVLDVGTGTGHWCVDFADQYPNATVIGTDLSPIQPNWVPPNVSFEVDDLDKDWSFCKPFDLIHIRNMVGAISDWPRFFKQAFDFLNPGGYLEIHESDLADVYSDDDTVDDSHPMRRVLKLNVQAGKKLGIDMAITKRLKGLAMEAGFDANEQIQKTPFSPWAKEPRQRELGIFALQLFQTGLEAYSLALMTRVLGMDANECRKLFADTIDVLRDSKKHAYGKQHIIVCRKPFC